MSDIKQRAFEARQLADYGPFLSIVDEILEDATSLFLNGSSAITEIARAHEAVRAVETFKAAIKSRLDAETVSDRKAQDRGSD